MQPSTSPHGHRAARLAAIVAVALCLLCLALAASLLPRDAEWIPGWLGLAAIYGVAAGGLFVRRPWARWLGLGGALWGLTCFVEAAVVVGPTPFFIAGIAGHASYVALLALAGPAPGASRSPRLAFALAAVGAALPCAALYALAPQPSWPVTLAVLAGALLIAAGAWALCRGRTWGLLATLAGAALTALTLTSATPLGWLLHPHPVFPTSNPLALQALGIVAVALSAAAALPCLGPAWRFLRSGRP